MVRVFTKATKRNGVQQPAVPTEYLVDIGAGNKSIQAFKDKNGVLVCGTKFVIGDTAEYDSYNLSYVGMIESISEKTVTIVKTRGENAVKHRLNINEFCWRNFNFNADETWRRNSEEMMNL
jgi:hypothetical protein